MSIQFFYLFTPINKYLISQWLNFPIKHLLAKLPIKYLHLETESGDKSNNRVKNYVLNQIKD